MRRVVKVGGSLLARPDLNRVLTQWLDRQAMAETLVVVGGGGLVDAIRELDANRPGDPVETHWLCVDLLGMTFRLMSTWFPWPIITTREQLQHGLSRGFSDHSPTLVAVHSFYRRDQDDENKTLPQNWQTTSDAIAALLALRVDADELVILKSCEIAPSLRIDELTARGILDEAMPAIAPSIRKIRVESLMQSPCDV